MGNNINKMADEDNNSPPPLESDEEDEGIDKNVEFSTTGALPASPSKSRQPTDSAATPSNT